MLPQLSRRVRATDAPIIVKTKQFIGSRQDVLSLAQGARSPAAGTTWTPSPGQILLALPGCHCDLAKEDTCSGCHVTAQALCTGRLLQGLWTLPQR